jgi:hypothetical protein
MASPVSRAVTSTASSSGPAVGLGADRHPRRSSWRALNRRASAFRDRITLGDLGVAGGAQPELVLEQGPPVGGIVELPGHVVPHGGQLTPGGIR